MKKIFWLLFAIVAFPFQMLSESYELNGIIYDLSVVSRVAKVIGSHSNLEGELIIPQEFTVIKSGTDITTYKVLEIRVEAFSNCNRISSISIPSTIEKVENGAFKNCSGLKKVVIEDGNSTISLGCNEFNNSYTSSEGAGLFADSQLESLYLGREIAYLNQGNTYPYSSNPERYGYSAFYNQTSLSEVILGNDVKTISQYMFAGCSGLKEIKLPYAISQISKCAFNGCVSLEGITIPSSVTLIANNAFQGCSGMSKLVFEDSSKGIKLGYNTNDVTGEIEGLFMDTNLESLYLGRNVILENKSFNTAPFKNLLQLKRVEIGDNVTYLVDYLFAGNRAVTDIIIPDSVTEIGNYTFFECAGITKIILPENITSIGGSAFKNCINLYKVELNDKIESIGAEGFEGCESLTEINLPESLTILQSKTFQDCTGLLKITLPESLSKIQYSCFSNCKSLQSITIPSNVLEIEYNVFEGCENLLELTLNDGATTLEIFSIRLDGIILPTFGNSSLETLYIGRNIKFDYDLEKVGFSPFYKQENLKDVTIGSEVKKINNYLFAGCRNLSELILPSSVEELGIETFRDCVNLNSIILSEHIVDIGSGCFENCENLQTINLPSELTQISTSLFEGCKSLYSITIPNSVISVANYSFNGCVGLKEVILEDGENDINLGDNYFQYEKPGAALFHDANLNYVYIGRNINLYPLTNAEQPHNSYSAFYNQKELTKIEFGPYVTQLPDYLFDSCISLEEIHFSDSIKKIGDYTFENCENLISLSFPLNLQDIGKHAFQGCGNLTSISLPFGLKNIGEEAFLACKALQFISIPGSVEFMNGSFKNCNKLCKVILEDSTLPLLVARNEFYFENELEEFYLGRDLIYRDSDDTFNRFLLGNDKSLKVTIGNTVTVLPPSLFKYLKNLREIILGVSLKEIGDYAFFDCSSLEEINFPESLITIGEGAFGLCTSLLSINLGTLEIIKERTFTNCFNLKKITLGNPLKEIGYEAFDNCKEISEISFPGTIEKIANYAFHGCEKLSRLRFEDGDSYLYLGEDVYAFSVFEDCPLKSLYIGKNLQYSGPYQTAPFSDKEELENVEIGEKVTELPYNLFSGCTGIKELTIPKNVEFLGVNMLKGCTSLEDLTFEDGGKELEFEDHFSGRGSPFTKDTSLKNLYLGRNLVYNTSYITPFDGRETLVNVTIGDSVTYLPDKLFLNCINIEKLNLGPNIINIGDLVFGGCESLPDVSLPQGVETIGANAFIRCKKLISFTFPSSVVKIGNNSFDRCEKITNLYFEDGEKDLEIVVYNDEPLFKNSPLKELYLGRNLSYPDYRSVGPFMNQNLLDTIIIGPEVKTLSDYLFMNCPLITELHIPENVRKIGVDVYKGCSNLTALVFENSGEPLMLDKAFNDTPIKEINIGRDLVFSSGESPFKKIETLERVIISGPVQNLPENIFTECEKLCEVIIEPDDSQICFGADAFSFTGLQHFYLGRSGEATGFPFNNTPLFYVTLGEGVREIGDNLFDELEYFKLESEAKVPPMINNPLKLSELKVPHGSTVAYAMAPYWEDMNYIYSQSDEIKYVPILIEQEGGNSIKVNDNVTSFEFPIGNDISINSDDISISNGVLLVGCKEITFQMMENKKYSYQASEYFRNNIIRYYDTSRFDILMEESGVLIDKIGVSNVDKVVSLKVTGDINGTDILAIRKMSNLKFLDLEDVNIVNGGSSYYQDFTTSENTIGDYFFYDKSNLVNVILPLSIEKIRENAFSDCKGLLSIAIPENVETIEDYAFSGCDNLTDVEIGENVVNLSSNTFKDCNRLFNFKVRDGNQALIIAEDCGALFATSPLIKIYLGRNISYSNSSSVSPLSGKLSLVTVEIGESVSELSDNLFNGCINLTSLSLGNNISHIRDRAFYECKGLAEINLPEQLTSLGNDVFYGCENITEVKFPQNLYSIGDKAFYECKSLVEINLPEQLTSLGNYVFYGCENITEVKFPQNLYSIGNFCFAGCIKLSSVNIPSNIKTVDYGAFRGCTNINTLKLEDTDTPITLNYTFIDSPIRNLYQGRKINTPDDFRLFMGKESLESVVIGNQVSSIPENSFKDCRNLRQVVLGNSVSEIGDSVFHGCEILEYIQSNNAVPPRIQASTFDIITEQSANLWVPFGCKIIYWMTPYWENFFYINEMETVAITGIILNVENIELQLGDSFQIEATIEPENALNQNITWTSSNPIVATVSETGVVTALAAGEVIITVYCGDVSASCEIIVVDDAGVESVLPNPEKKISVYTHSGLLMRKDCNAEELKKLSKGIYIIVSGRERYKISI